MRCWKTPGLGIETSQSVQTTFGRDDRGGLGAVSEWRGWLVAWILAIRGL